MFIFDGYKYDEYVNLHVKEFFYLTLNIWRGI